MRYRRSLTPGATYFFTVVTYDRCPILCEPVHVELLRTAFKTVMQRHPFQIDAFILLPDHLHCIWTLPEGDANFSMRWRLIKTYFARKCETDAGSVVSASRQLKGERQIWQRRFWEHQVRDLVD
jgi:putative transposase